MQSFQFYCPTRVVFGCGKIAQLGQHIDPSFQRLLLVTDKGVLDNSAAITAVQAALPGRTTAIFAAIDENPSFANIEQGACAAAEMGAQMVIGIGGGSPMDAAKGIAMRATGNRSAQEIVAGAPLTSAPLPIACVPTTAGTGSETTPYVVLTDVAGENKCGYGHDALYPQLALIDPELGFSMPERLIVHTGLDALTHAIEAYLCTAATPITDCLAREVMTIVLDRLPAAAKHDPSSLSAMAYAAALAGIAIANAGTVLLHVMAYPLTVYHHVPHGLANAVLLPRFYEFMRQRAPHNEKVGQIGAFFQRVGGVASFIHALGVSTALADYGVKPEEYERYAQKTIVKSDVRLTPTEEPITLQDIVALLAQATK